MASGSRGEMAASWVEQGRAPMGYAQAKKEVLNPVSLKNWVSSE